MKILYYNITYKCNNDCIFCAADHGYNTSNAEMKIQDFCSAISMQKIVKDDRIIINGGEPTVHPDFIDFLKIAYSSGAYIDLYTNGRKFKDANFTEKVISYSPMLIRIPLFGSKASIHDKLTGKSGSFNDTMQGIENIIALKGNLPVRLEIKLLLSKATCFENKNIYWDLLAKLPNSFYISFNPLLISNRVKSNKDIMIEPCSDSLLKSMDLISEIKKAGREVSLSLIPFCILPKELYPKGVNRKTAEIYTEPGMMKEVKNDLTSPKCRYCSYKYICPGFPASYINYMGDGEVKPIIIPAK